MNKDTQKIIRLCYSVILSIMLLITAVLFMVSCVGIYNSGPYPFTRESIAEAFSKIAVVVYITLALSLLGVVIHFVFPTEEGKLKGEKSNARTLSNLRKRMSVNEISSDSLCNSIEAEIKLRRILSVITAALFAVGSVISLVRLLNLGNYSSPTDPSFDPNGEVMTSAIVIILALLVPTVLSVVLVFVFDRSREREISYMKEAMRLPKNETSNDVECPVSKITSFFKKNEKTVVLVARCTIITLSVALISLGIFNGGVEGVLQKAIKICKECIGMG